MPEPLDRFDLDTELDMMVNGWKYWAGLRASLTHGTERNAADTKAVEYLRKIHSHLYDHPTLYPWVDDQFSAPVDVTNITGLLRQNKYYGRFGVIVIDSPGSRTGISLDSPEALRKLARIITDLAVDWERLRHEPDRNSLGQIKGEN